MYKSFSVKNFRCFKDFRIDSLDQVNLLAGKNNVGKTALLEAIWLHHGFQNPALVVAVDNFRGQPVAYGPEFLWDLFAEFDTEHAIEISGTNEQGKTELLKIMTGQGLSASVPVTKENGSRPIGFQTQDMLELQSAKAIQPELRFEFTDGSNKPPLKGLLRPRPNALDIQGPSGVTRSEAIFLAARRMDNPQELATRFGNVAISKKKGGLIDIMRIIEPRLQDLSVQTSSGTLPMVFGDIGKDRLFPLAVMGDGMVRLLSISLAIANVGNGVLAIDEIENGLHHSIMTRVWTAIAELAREFHAQIFATTHSLECARSAHEAFSAGDQYDFRIHRLEANEQGTRAITFDKESLASALEMGLEIR